MTLKTINDYIKAYLDYANNFLTVEAYADSNNIDKQEADVIIELGKKYNNDYKLSTLGITHYLSGERSKVYIHKVSGNYKIDHLPTGSFYLNRTFVKTSIKTDTREVYNINPLEYVPLFEGETITHSKDELNNRYKKV